MHLSSSGEAYFRAEEMLSDVNVIEASPSNGKDTSAAPSHDATPKKLDTHAMHGGLDESSVRNLELDAAGDENRKEDEDVTLASMNSGNGADDVPAVQQETAAVAHARVICEELTNTAHELGSPVKQTANDNEPDPVGELCKASAGCRVSTPLVKTNLLQCIDGMEGIETTPAMEEVTARDSAISDDEERNGAVKDSVGCVQAADDLLDDYASSRATEEEMEFDRTVMAAAVQVDNEVTIKSVTLGVVKESHAAGTNTENLQVLEQATTARGGSTTGESTASNSKGTLGKDGGGLKYTLGASGSVEHLSEEIFPNVDTALTTSPHSFVKTPSSPFTETDLSEYSVGGESEYDASVYSSESEEVSSHKVRVKRSPCCCICL